MSPHGTVSRYTNGRCRCARCRQELPVSQFAHDGRTMDRLKYRCETCIAELGAYKR